MLRVPARWLVRPGLLLVGAGLILMGGLSGDSTWTHLIPGFIVAGLAPAWLTRRWPRPPSA